MLKNGITYISIMSKVMISMPQELLEELDKAAKANHKRRSELLKDLVLEYLRWGKIAGGGPRSYHPSPRQAINDLREFTFKMESGETAEDLIRKERESH